MGKSPGKWIKTVLFGKKSKSNGSKGRERVSNEKAVLVAAKAAETDVSLEPSLVANQVPDPADGSINKLEVENNGATNISDDDVPGNQYTNSQKSTSEDVLSDSEKEHQEKAATAVQAAFRGYLARRAFWALKGIIRLQALIRGHLVRRQAVSTLCCTMGIVKLQALVRGRQIRHSVIGVEIQRKCSQGQTLKGKLVVSLGSDMPSQIKKLSTNAFVSKLLASSPTVMPLHLHYDSSDPNSVLSWLERWSASRFWKPVCQPKKVSNSKSQRKHTNGHIGETETGRPKRSVRKVPAANFDSISAVQATFEFEKPKRIYRKLSGHPADLVQDNPQSELEKVKRNLRKVHNPVLDNSVQSEVEFEKPKLSVEKVSATSTHDPPEQGMNHSGEKIRKETILAVAKQTEVETIPVPLEVADTLDLSCDDQDVVESKPLIESESKDENVPTTNGELNQKEDLIGNENKKSSRKASTAAKQEFVENGVQHSPTVPSYMQATESAKAKLRLQGSPRSGLDAVEKNNVTRRHSLPSSANSKISSQSPRTHRVVHAGAKGGNKSEKSLSARDGNAKVAQAEWRR